MNLLALGRPLLFPRSHSGSPSLAIFSISDFFKRQSPLLWRNGLNKPLVFWDNHLSFFGGEIVNRP